MDLLKKEEILRKSEQVLKSEFAGLDKVIDQFINSTRSWFIMPQFQKRPKVVNLWGLTGVGKTSLLNRFVELTHNKNHFLYFNLSSFTNASNSNSISETLKEISSRQHPDPLILAFDEFQNASESEIGGYERDVKNMKILWEILGHGYFYYWNYANVHELERLLLRLKILVRRGVKVQNGIVVEKVELFRNELESELSLTNFEKIDHFIPDSFVQDIFEASFHNFDTRSDLKNHLMEFDELKSLNFLESVIEKAQAPVKIDCSKSIVFIIGNLDEAYQMSYNFSADVSADTIHKQTKKINISIIKEILKKDFRPEQISKLGNNHIIYPSLNCNAFMKIIEMELERIQSNLLNQFHMKIIFDESVKKLIYKEGVIPSQGTRPLYSTIENLIENNLSKIYYEKERKGIQNCEYKFSCTGSDLIVSFLKENELLDQLKIKLNLSYNTIRENKSKQEQAITAVHESGHAVAGIILLQKIPDIIYSVTTDNNLAGVTYFDINNEFMNRFNFYGIVSVLLAGFAAERQIFGEQYISAGSQFDFERATEIASLMIKKCGMGSVIGNFESAGHHANFSLIDHKRKLNIEIKDFLQQRLESVGKTLSVNSMLLMSLSEHLSKNDFITRSEIEMIIKRYYDGEFLDKCNSDSNIPDYSSILEEQIKKNLKQYRTIIKEVK